MSIIVSRRIPTPHTVGSNALSEHRTQRCARVGRWSIGTLCSAAHPTLTCSWARIERQKKENCQRRVPSEEAISVAKVAEMAVEMAVEKAERRTVAMAAPQRLAQVALS